SRNSRAYFDVWTSFAARRYRQNPQPRVEDFQAGDYRIEASISEDLSLSVITRFKLRTQRDGATVIPMGIASDIAVTGVTVDGKPAEILQRESVRANVSRGGNELFLVLPPDPLRTGRDYELVLHHSGRVIRDAGGRVMLVTARGNWYPTVGMGFSTYDLT